MKIQHRYKPWDYYLEWDGDRKLEVVHNDGVRKDISSDWSKSAIENNLKRSDWVEVKKSFEKLLITTSAGNPR